jgi:DNA invertase Pin-like site-specific DNA recombinase
MLYNKGVVENVMSNDESVIFCRVSTQPQFERASPEDQERICSDYAKDKHLHPVKTVNVPESGYKSRKHFRDMLDFIKNNHIGHLITLNLERLTRDMQGFLDVHKMVTDAGLTVHLVESHEIIDINSTKDAKCIWMMKVVFSEWIIAGQKDKARRSMEGRLERGGWPFVHPPFGYDLDHDHLTPNEDAKFVRRAFELYAAGGENTRSLHELLKKEGLKLSQPALGQVLRNRAYIGDLEWPWEESKYVAAKHSKGDIIKGNHEPLISRSLFDRVQILLKERAYSHPFKANQKFFLYRGLLRCECGKVMSGAMINGHVRYISNHTAEKRCAVKGVQETVIDRIIQNVLQLFMPPPVTRELLETAYDMRHEKARADRARARAEYNRAQKALDKLCSKSIRTVFDPKTIRGQEEELRARRDRAQATLDSLANENTRGREKWIEEGMAMLKVQGDLNGPYWKEPQHRVRVLRALFKEIKIRANNKYTAVMADPFGDFIDIKESDSIGS